MELLKKKALWFIGMLSLCMILGLQYKCIVASAATTGTTSDGLGYKIENGEATITSYSGTATEVVIPEKISGYKVTKIGEETFCFNVKIATVSISANVKDIRTAAFMGCDNLTAINVDDRNESYSSHEGVLFNKDKSILIEAPLGKSGIYNIPTSVTSIGDSAFWGCSNLTKITVPESVTSIGNGAFGECKRLTTMTIPSGVTSIGYETFFGCDSLRTITIPASVTDIGAAAFCYCESLTTIKIPSGITCINDSTFQDCTSLTSITIPTSVREISYYAFAGCESLISIEIPTSVTNIESFAFYGCDNLTNVAIPTSVTSIKEDVFGDCGRLKSITIPTSIISIEGCAFYNCDSLTTIIIPTSVTSIDESAFRFCDNVVIYCEKGSYAEQYAKENELKYSTIAPEFYLGNYTATISQPSFTYTGDYIKPVVTVKGTVNGKTVTLTNWKDYKVTYKNFKAPGTATITVTGRGNYEGVLTLNFTIKPFNISKLRASISQPSFIYTGNYIKPVVTVKGAVGGKAVTLTNWKDYKVTYKNFKNAGTASITVTGRGNYTGTLSLKFTIKPFNLSKLKASIRQSSFAYTGKYIKPVVTVKGTVGGKAVTLANWRDYKVAYKNFKNPGKATITVTGRGNYTGTLGLTFTIRPA